jgi:hypothetical protein
MEFNFKYIELLTIGGIFNEKVQNFYLSKVLCDGNIFHLLRYNRYTHSVHWLRSFICGIRLVDTLDHK